jgi:hypothetical protein
MSDIHFEEPANKKMKEKERDRAERMMIERLFVMEGRSLEVTANEVFTFCEISHIRKERPQIISKETHKDIKIEHDVCLVTF